MDPADLFDRNGEAADQRRDFIQPRRFGRLDRTSQTGDAFVVAEFGYVGRQNRGGQERNVEQDVWHGNRLRKIPALTTIHAN